MEPLNRICTTCHRPFMLKPGPAGRERTRCYQCRPVRSAKDPAPVATVCAYCQGVWDRPVGSRALYCSERCDWLAEADSWWRDVEIATHSGGVAMERTYARARGEHVEEVLTDGERAKRWTRIKRRAALAR
jgi:hypothetical protein